MPGICHSSAPQCSGHKTGKPGPVYEQVSSMDRLKHKSATICRCRPGNCKDRQKKRCPSHPGSACKVDMIRPAVHPLSRFIQKPDLVASDTEDMRPLRPHRPLPGCAQPTQQAPWILNQDAHDAQMDTIRKFLGCKPAKCNPN